MKILHISDIHFRKVYDICEKGYKSIFNKMTNPAVLLDRCVKRALEEPVDLVVVTGDLTENGTSEDYRELKKVLENTLQGVPYILTLGNHDVKSAFWEGWYGEKKGDVPYNIVWESEEFAIVSMDSSIEGNPDGIISGEQIEWLKSQTDRLDGKPYILMTHHHFMKEQGVVPPVICPEGLIKVLKNSNIFGILCGHTHHHFTSRYHGIPYFTTNSLSFAGEEEEGSVEFEEKYGYSYYECADKMFKSHKIETYSPGKHLGSVVF